MAKKRCKCPGKEVWERGHTRDEAWAATEAAANAALPALIANARAAAIAAQAAAHNAGDNACEAGCTAWFKDAPLDGPWTAVGSVAPYTQWLARAGFIWEVWVRCDKIAEEKKKAGGEKKKKKKFL